jgi:hypothetical protein
MGFAALDEIEMREAVHRLRAALDASRESRPTKMRRTPD